LEESFMIKKTIGSLVAVSALSIGLLGFNLEAEASTGVTQNQDFSGAWASKYKTQSSSVTGAGSSQAKSGAATGFQLQYGKTKGEAAATQTTASEIEVGQTAGQTAEQTTATSNPTTVLQSQRTSAALFNFQGSIEGGASIQNQMAQGHSYQFNAAAARP
jgi:hypothetical protein